jgi:hypothetical protein
MAVMIAFGAQARGSKASGMEGSRGAPFSRFAGEGGLRVSEGRMRAFVKIANLERRGIQRM